MRTERPVLICDADEDCDVWTIDYYEECASAVDGVPITQSARSPGWTSTDETDFCLEHRAIAQIAPSKFEPDVSSPE